jgi:hypothetical protein
MSQEKININQVIQHLEKLTKLTLKDFQVFMEYVSALVYVVRNGMVPNLKTFEEAIGRRYRVYIDYTKNVLDVARQIEGLHVDGEIREILNDIQTVPTDIDMGCAFAKLGMEVMIVENPTLGIMNREDVLKEMYKKGKEPTNLRELIFFASVFKPRNLRARESFDIHVIESTEPSARFVKTLIHPSAGEMSITTCAPIRPSGSLFLVINKGSRWASCIDV